MTPYCDLEMVFYFCSNHATETYICRVNYLLLLDANDVRTSEIFKIPCVVCVYLGFM